MKFTFSLIPDEGKDVVTPLLYGPVNTTRLHQTQFFTDKSTDPDMDPGGTEVINFTVQFPRDLNDPQGKFLSTLWWGTRNPLGGDTWFVGFINHISVRLWNWYVKDNNNDTS